MTRGDAVDLLAEARALVRTNASYEMLVRVAADQLRRFSGHDGQVHDLAMAALDAASHVMRGVEALNNDVERRHNSPAIQEGLRVAISKAMATSAPAPRSEQISAAIKSVSGDPALTIHRFGTALWKAIEQGTVDRKHRAKDRELFAALGLFLLVCGMQRAPMPDGIDRTDTLLQASECILGWQHLREERQVRALWIDDLHGMLPELLTDEGRPMKAKEAQRRFLERFPAHTQRAGHLGTFSNELSEARRATSPT